MLSINLPNATSTNNDVSEFINVMKKNATTIETDLTCKTLLSKLKSNGDKKSTANSSKISEPLAFVGLGKSWITNHFFHRNFDGNDNIFSLKVQDTRKELSKLVNNIRKTTEMYTQPQKFGDFNNFNSPKFTIHDINLVAPKLINPNTMNTMDNFNGKNNPNWLHQLQDNTEIIKTQLSTTSVTGIISQSGKEFGMTHNENLSTPRKAHFDIQETERYLPNENCHDHTSCCRNLEMKISQLQKKLDIYKKVMDKLTHTKKFNRNHKKSEKRVLKLSEQHLHDIETSSSSDTETLDYRNHSIPLKTIYKEPDLKKKVVKYRKKDLNKFNLPIVIQSGE